MTYGGGCGSVTWQSQHQCCSDSLALLGHKMSAAPPSPQPQEFSPSILANWYSGDPLKPRYHVHIPGWRMAAGEGKGLFVRRANTFSESPSEAPSPAPR